MRAEEQVRRKAIDSELLFLGERGLLSAGKGARKNAFRSS